MDISTASDSVSVNALASRVNLPTWLACTRQSTRCSPFCMIVTVWLAESSNCAPFKSSEIFVDLSLFKKLCTTPEIVTVSPWVRKRGISSRMITSLRAIVF